MATRDEAVLALAQAVAALTEVERGPHDLLSRLEAAGQRMNEAIAEVDTIEELFESLGDQLIDLVIQAGTQYIKNAGPLGLAEAALKGVGDVADFISGGK